MMERIDRESYESAYQKMEKYGVEAFFFSKNYIAKKDYIRNSMLSYYEGTEEYEKCEFIKRFFNDLEAMIIRSKNETNVF
jgi:hypothetical protein